MFKYLSLIVIAFALTACNPADRAKDMADGAMDTVKDAGGAVVDGAGKMVDGAKEMGGDMVDGAKDAGEAMVDGAGKMVDGAKEMGGDMVDGAKDAGEAMVDGMKDAGEAMKDGAEKVMEEGKEMMDGDKEVEVDNSAAAPQYQAYSAEAAQGKHAIFFHAAWCGKCKKFDEALSGAVNTMPNGSLVLKADFDAEEDLKKKYGVTSQHTTVFINADGSVERLIMGASAEQVEEFFQS